jgi:hypothetical protein
MRRRTCLDLSLTILFVLIVRYAAAQSAAEIKTEFGLHRAAFRVPGGTIRVNFPDDLSAGDTISGTVYTEPTANSGGLSGYVVDLQGGMASTSAGRFVWKVPGTIADGVSTLVLRDRKNRVIAQCLLPVNRPVAPADKTEFLLPHGAEAGSLVSAGVPSSGDLGTSVSVGGTDAPVIAESPRKVIFQTPQELIGPSLLKIAKGSQSTSGDFYSLRLVLSASQTALKSGETATLSITVIGLQGLNEPATLTILDHSPQIVALTGGPLQRIPIPPGVVGPSGRFQLTRTLTGEVGGEFQITVVVSRSPTAQIPMQQVATQTIDNWSRANNITVSADARAQIASDLNAARPELDEFLRIQLVYHADIAELVDWMMRDYCFELRDRHAALALARSRHSQVGPGLVRAFLPQEPGAKMTLGASDVKSYSFLQYLAELLSRLTPSPAVANIVVTSDPLGQQITFDGRSGSLFTMQSFVVSPGDHSITIATCRKRVTVAINESITVNCP